MKEENHQKARASDQLRFGIQVKKDWTISWWEQFVILSKRTFIERWRDYFDKLRLVQALGVALLLGLLWWKSKYGTEAQLRDQVCTPVWYCSRFQFSFSWKHRKSSSSNFFQKTVFKKVLSRQQTSQKLNCKISKVLMMVVSQNPKTKKNKNIVLWVECLSCLFSLLLYFF